MISVQEVVQDPDFIAPAYFTVLRSTGQFVLGGFQSVTTPIQMFGPVQQASDKEIQMLPESDRIGSIRTFWSVQPIYLTRGQASVPSTHTEAPAGGGTGYTLSAAPPGGTATLYANGMQLRPDGVDYTLTGRVITLRVATLPGTLYATWPTTVMTATNASDIIQYGEETYRVLSVYYDPGSGYWKATGTRMAAS